MGFLYNTKFTGQENQHYLNDRTAGRALAWHVGLDPWYLIFDMVPRSLALSCDQKKIPGFPPAELMAKPCSTEQLRGGPGGIFLGYVRMPAHPHTLASGLAFRIWPLN